MKSTPTLVDVFGKVKRAQALYDLTPKDLAILCKTDIAISLSVYLTKEDLLKIYSVKKGEDIPDERLSNYIKQSEVNLKKAGLGGSGRIEIANFRIENFVKDDVLTKKYSPRNTVQIYVPKQERKCKGWYVPLKVMEPFLTEVKDKYKSKLDGEYSIGDCFNIIKKLYESEYKGLKFFSYSINISQDAYDKYFEFLSAFPSFNNDIAINAVYFGWHKDGVGDVFQIRFTPQGSKARVIFYFPDTHSALIFKGNKLKPFEMITDKSEISSMKDILIRNNTLK